MNNSETKRMKKYALLLALAMLAGCQSISEVTQIGKDTYQVDATTRGGFQSHGETTALAVAKAREFCAAQGKQLQAAPARTSGARGWTPVESDLTFQCLDANDPAYIRPDLSKLSASPK
jgi:hypothetical protein